MVATNTRFTDDAIAFAQAYNVHILSWDYPRGESLRVGYSCTGRIRLPACPACPRQRSTLLVSHGLVSCRTIYKDMSVLDKLSLPRNKKSALRKELIYLYDNLLAEKDKG